MKSRTRARGVALQVLYEVDITKHPAAEAFKARLEEAPLSDDLAEFVRRIIFGVLPLVNELDQLISRYAPEWPLEQIAAIDRNILRIALWEFAVQRETPIKVAINEAVELAKLYGSDSAPRFVNGVLGSLADYQHEIHQQVHLKQGDSFEMEILGIGMPELLFIVLIAIIVLGPRDMQKAGRTIGRWLRELTTSDAWKVFQQTSRELRALPTRLMREAQFDELDRELHQTLDPRAAPGPPNQPVPPPGGEPKPDA